MNKVEHLLKLADEYHAISVFDLCVKCLKDEPKSEENVMKILLLANKTVMAREDDRLDSVRKKCYDLIENMQLTGILEKTEFKKLDRETLENIFVQKTKRLEMFLNEIYPQFTGLVEYALWACMEISSVSGSTKITPCPQHFFNKKKNEDLVLRIKSCPVCKTMIEQLVSSFKSAHTSLSVVGGLFGNTGSGLFGSKPSTTSGSIYSCNSGDSNYFTFDEKLVSIIQDFHNILKP